MRYSDFAKHLALSGQNMSCVTERMSGKRKRVCIQDVGIGTMYIDWEDWVILQSEYGFSADTENLYQKVRELVDSDIEPGSRLTHDW